MRGARAGVLAEIAVLEVGESHLRMHGGKTNFLPTSPPLRGRPRHLDG
jgi:hypothetical protein